MSNNLNHKESEQVWEMSKNYQPNFEPDVEKGLARLNRRIGESKKQEAKIVPMRRRFLFRAAAAVLLLAITTLGINYFFNSGAEWVTVVANTEVKEVTLPDGSSVWLNKNAQLSYIQEFEGSTRQIKLEGEAFFDVTRNPAKPFIIDAGEGQIKVLGTSFSIDTRQEQTEVLVKSGKVAFKGNKQAKEVYLTKNMKAIFDKEADIVTVNKDVSLNELAWQSGKLFFKGATLAEVLKEIEIVYNTSIQLNNNSIAGCSWTEKMDIQKDSIEVSLANLAEHFQLTLSYNGGVIELNGDKEGCQ